MTTDDLDEDPITPARFDALVAFLLARLDEDEAAARTVLLDREFLPSSRSCRPPTTARGTVPCGYSGRSPRSGRWCRSIASAGMRSWTDSRSGDSTSRRH